MKLKLRGNPAVADATVGLYLRAANISAVQGTTVEEQAVGRFVDRAIDQAGASGVNVTDAVMQCLANFDAATRRMREELKGIHGVGM